MKTWIIIILSIPILVFAGCHQKTTFQTARLMASGIAATNHYAREFRNLIPKHQFFITGLESKNAPPYFFCERILHDRYLLTLILRLEIDSASGEAKTEFLPRFLLQEFSSLQPYKNSYRINFKSGSQKEFFATTWSNFVASRGDLLVLKANATTNDPIPSVDRYFTRLGTNSVY